MLASESDYVISSDVSNADVDVGLDELVKAVNTAKNKDGKPPLQTTEETEAASKKAAKFAAQMRRVGDQRARAGDEGGQAYAKRMAAHADALSAANRAMVRRDPLRCWRRQPSRRWRRTMRTCRIRTTAR